MLIPLLMGGGKTSRAVIVPVMTIGRGGDIPPPVVRALNWNRGSQFYEGCTYSNFV